jgi:succinyl-CoA synthetase alpha subunit
MSILLDRSNRVLVQGVTGQMGQFFVEDARKYGTNMVAGVAGPSRHDGRRCAGVCQRARGT